MVAEVIINSNVKTLNKTFDYNVPENLSGTIAIGQRVLVPFGKNKKLEEGFIINFKEKSDYKIKDIAKVEEGYFLKETSIKLAIYMAKRYFCNISDCIKLMLPPGTTTKDIDKRITDKKINFVYLIKKEKEIIEEIQKNKSGKQIRVLKFLLQNDGISKVDLQEITETEGYVIKALEKKGFIEIVQEKVDRNPFINKKIEKNSRLKINEEQEIAYDKIAKAIDINQFEEFLLYGVTGSR